MALPSAIDTEDFVSDHMHEGQDRLGETVQASFVIREQVHDPQLLPLARNCFLQDYTFRGIIYYNINSYLLLVYLSFFKNMIIEGK